VFVDVEPPVDCGAAVLTAAVGVVVVLAAAAVVAVVVGVVVGVIVELIADVADDAAAEAPYSASITSLPSISPHLSMLRPSKLTVLSWPAGRATLPGY
jgi:hypothetical protein